jgi:hypothetical protein
MAYADSAIDYTWEILRIDVAQRLMQVKYSTADSARPDIILNLEPLATEFNESDLTTVATSSVGVAVTEWDRVIEAVNANPSFDPTTLEGNSYNSRYKVKLYDDSMPAFNALTHRMVAYDSEGPDDICTKYNKVALSDSDKASLRDTVQVSNQFLWSALLEESRLDSVVDLLGITGVDFDQYDQNNIDMVIGNSISFLDSVSEQIQNLYSYNDSDWVSWLVQNGAEFDPYVVHQISY